MYEEHKDAYVPMDIARGFLNQEDQELNEAIRTVRTAILDLKSALDDIEEYSSVDCSEEAAALSVVIEDAEEVHRQLHYRYLDEAYHDLSRLEHLLERAEGEPDEE